MAYSHEPELDNASAMKVKVVSAEKREVLRVEMTDINDNKLTKDLPYGRKVKAKAYTTGMVGEKILFKMWEDDAEGGGHSEENKYNLVAQAMGKVGEKGLAIVEFTLKPDFKVIAKAHAGKGGEGKTHEYYVTAVATLKSNYVAGSNFNVYSPEEIKKVEEDQLKGNPPKENTPPSAVEKVEVKPDKIEIDVPTNVTKTKVEDSKTDVPKIEALIDAYFAKEEFTKETTEKAGKQQYTFKNENKNIDKDKIATIIKKKVDADLKKDKKYSKLEDIKAALTKTTYAKNEVISFDVYKLGANFVKINNAPLEEEIYVVAKTVLLDGKEVNIKIKEKEEILIAKTADLPVQEAKKEGAELTTLKATVEKGEAKIKIKLRPKSDEDLKKWKEKLAGIKDGQYTYTFGGKNDTSTDAKKKTVAGVIIKKIKDELAKNKKFSKAEDIVKSLANVSYDKGEKITFDTYKVPTEYLWLQAECQGNVKKHEGEFLKKEGSYFEIGKKCECEAKIRAFMRVLRIANDFISNKQANYTHFLMKKTGAL